MAGEPGDGGSRHGLREHGVVVVVAGACWTKKVQAVRVHECIAAVEQMAGPFVW